MMSSLLLPAYITSPYYLVPSLLISWILWKWVRLSIRHSRLPPGPRGLPFLGNIFQISAMPWLRFDEWKNQYGPIFSLTVAGQPVVVINTIKIGAELLDRRSSIYSDRPRFIVGDILTGRMFLPFSRAGDMWRRLRKASHIGLNIRASEAYLPLQERESAVLVQAFLREPKIWDEHLRRAAASSIQSAMYALPPIEAADDPLVIHINDLMHRMAKAGLPGSYLVDIFPFMNIFPVWMAKWKRDAIMHHKNDTKLFVNLVEEVKFKLDQGSTQPSFASYMIQTEKEHGLSLTESQVDFSSGAGAETTAAALSVFMLSIITHPEVKRRAQAEIDDVVGRSRMPTFMDKDNLPYITAIVKEVLRWRPVGPLGMPKRTVQDDVYEGYFIPKGSLVLSNIWSMNRDPSVFSEPDKFKPERHLDATGQKEVIFPDTHGYGHVSFGFGRRICVGLHVTLNTLWIDIACLLWGFNIDPAVDENGIELLPDPSRSIDEGLVVRPEPFECQIVPRSPDVQNIVAEVRRDAMIS